MADFKTNEAGGYMRMMFDTMPFACNLWNKDFELVVFNDEAVRLYGLENRDEYIKRFFEFSPECQPCGRLSKELTRERLIKAFESGYDRFEWMHITQDNEPLPCEITLTRIEHEGEPHIAAYTRDLREEKAAKEKIAEESARVEALAYWYESILDATPLPITVTDADMNWTFVNKAVEDFLGTKREDMYGKPCSNWNAHICNTEDCGIACARRGLKRTYLIKSRSWLCWRVRRPLTLLLTFLPFPEDKLYPARFLYILPFRRSYL
jgi:PAS domain-containing protein